MKEFSLISDYMLKGIHTKENPSKNEKKSRNERFLKNLQGNKKGIHIKENPSRNEGILFNF